jgi:hypothetical protein
MTISYKETREKKEKEKKIIKNKKKLIPTPKLIFNSKI